MRTTRTALIILSVVAFVSSTQAKVTLNALFSDNAVFQRNMPVPIWGTAAPNEVVTAEFSSQKKVATADSQGRWKVILDPMSASAEPRTLTITGSTDNHKSQIRNILVGEVWICSGQSNMAFDFKGVANAATEGPLANYPKLRMFKVNAKAALQPQTEIAGMWVECSPKTVEGFSAVGYFFGRDIHKATGVPVGMIHSSVSGTPAEYWVSLSGLQKEPAFPGYLETLRIRMANYDQESVKYSKELADYPAKLKEWDEQTGKVYNEALKAWGDENKKNKAEGKPQLLKPQPSVPKPTPPAVPERGAATQLFNAKIAPLIPYAIKGVIWYQGESNSRKPFEYRTLFSRLIADWREKWGEGDFPFLFVQIAPFNGNPPELREAQFLTWKKTANTAMAVITDSPAALHPAQKEPVGKRLALAARALAYGEKIEYSGPEYDSMKIDRNRVILSFKHVGSGLAAKDGPLKGFTIAGADKNFVDAQADIQGDSVVVTSDRVPVPVAVRYGWASIPDVNLWNKEGLPASPFRTDPESLTQDVSAPRRP